MTTSTTVIRENRTIDRGLNLGTEDVGGNCISDGYSTQIELSLCAHRDFVGDVFGWKSHIDLSDNTVQCVEGCLEYPLQKAVFKPGFAGLFFM